MKKVSIIGAAGTLGASCAMMLSVHSAIDELCLIDVNERLLDNHIMDFENAFPSKNIYRGSFKDLIHSDIVIIVAGVPNRNNETSRNAYLADNIKIIHHIGEQITRYAPEAIIVTASNPVDALNYYLYRNFCFKRSKLIGYTLNDSFRFEWALRKVLEINNKESVQASVLGEHGQSQVPIFSRVLLSNRQLSLTKEQKQQIQEELKTWFVRFNGLNIHRTTGWTTGVGISQLINQLLTDEIVPSIGSAILDGEYGFENVSMGVPLLINNEGIQEIIEWNLEAEESNTLSQSALAIKALIQENNIHFVN